jgi:hypothetical protein
MRRQQTSAEEGIFRRNQADFSQLPSQAIPWFESPSHILTISARHHLLHFSDTIVVPEELVESGLPI